MDLRYLWISYQISYNVRGWGGGTGILVQCKVNAVR